MSDVGKRRLLEREHQARTIRVAGAIEGRPSRADEQAIADLIGIRERRQARADVERSIASMRAQLDLLAGALRRASPGDHRDPLRMIRRGLDALERAAK